MPSTSKHPTIPTFVSCDGSHYVRVVCSTNILFMGTVALVFAPLAPLVVFAGAVVFWLSSWVYKYQLMFVFTSKVESGGVSWIHLLGWSDLMFGLIL